MRHLALTVAGCWITWVLFGLVAYFGAVALICWAVCRFTRIQDRKLATETAHAADDLGYGQVRSILDGCTWCKPKPDGHCSCTAKCGHIRCVAPRSLFTAADQEILEREEAAVSEPYSPGVYDIPEADYFGASYALSCSGAKLLLPPSCPAKFFYRQDHAEYKAVWNFGSGAHNMVLGTGPEIAECEFGDWRKKAAQEQRDAAIAEGKIPLLTKELAVVKGMAEAIRAHPIAGFLFDPYDGQPEQSLFWEHERTGIPLRARLDWLPGISTGRPIIADYKTADSAEPEKFRKGAADYGYHQQHAWYADGLAALYGVLPSFIFVVQEKTPPYLVSIVEWHPEAVRIGRARNERAIDIYRACIKNGEWPGYTDTEPAEIMLPAWADKGDF